MEGDDDDEDPGAKMKISYKSYKFCWDDNAEQWKTQLLGSKVEMASTSTWPPPAGDLDEDDDDDPEDGCENCQDSPFSPGRAWDAFYERGYSLRDSWCAGRCCFDMSDAEDEGEEAASPSPVFILSPDGSSRCQTQPFLSNQKIPAIAAVDKAVQLFWRPWEDEQEDPVKGKTKSDTVIDVLAGQNTAEDTKNLSA